MRQVTIALALLFLAAGAYSQEIRMAGTWQLYRTDTIGTYSLNEFRTGAPTRSFIDATLVLNEDGTVESDSPGLRFIRWQFEANGFLAFETPSGNSFYRIRDVTPDVLFLVSVIVTERNATVTQIEVNRNAHLLLVRAGQ
jgi:hypothetical protein